MHAELYVLLLSTHRNSVPLTSCYLLLLTEVNCTFSRPTQAEELDQLSSSEMMGMLKFGAAAIFRGGNREPTDGELDAICDRARGADDAAVGALRGGQAADAASCFASEQPPTDAELAAIIDRSRTSNTTLGGVRAVGLVPRTRHFCRRTAFVRTLDASCRLTAPLRIADASRRLTMIVDSPHLSSPRTRLAASLHLSEALDASHRASLHYG